MPWIPLVAAGVGALGSVIAGKSTADAQRDANAQNAASAAAAQQQQMALYLLSRGINPGTIPGLGGTAGGSVNTLLPVGANINGQPAEMAILNSLFGNSGLVQATPDVYTSEQNINAFLQSNPNVLQEITDAMAGSDDTRTPAQWLHDHVTQTEAQSGGGTFTSYLKNFAENPAGAGAPAGPGTNTFASTTSGQIPAEINAINQNALRSLGAVYNGGLLDTEMNALRGVADARSQLADLGFARNTELRGGAANILGTGTTGANNILNTRLAAVDDILGTQLGGLTNVLGARRTAAGDILSTELSGLANLRGVSETGANNIYGAELLGADTYENAVKQAVSRTLEQNRASRALRGFSGDSSADALTRARTLASGYQQAGGARAAAGVNLQQLLNQVRREEASGQLTSRSKSATSVGEANIQDALGRLQANTTAATARGGAREGNAISLSTLNNDYAKTLAGILDTDAQRGVLTAGLQNAADRSALIGNDITRQLNSTGAANSLYGSTLNLTNQAANARYSDINALINSLGFFRQGQPATPTITPTQNNPVINNGQIIGSGLTAVGTGISDYYNNRNLINAINRSGTPTNTTPDDGSYIV